MTIKRINCLLFSLLYKTPNGFQCVDSILHRPDLQLGVVTLGSRTQENGWGAPRGTDETVINEGTDRGDGLKLETCSSLTRN